MRKPSLVGGACLALAVAHPVAAIPNSAISAAWANYVEEDDEELALLVDTYECAVAMISLEDNAGMTFDTDVEYVIADFDARIAESPYTETQVKQALDKRIAFWKSQLNPEDYLTWASDLGEGCDQMYTELRSRPPEPSGKPQVIDAQYLRAHLAKTGDYRNVADFIVYTYPAGSNPFAENPMGELLGEMVVAAGSKGVIMFSDAAITAMVEHHYWKYNPPATRIVDAEYRRRLRALRMTSEQGSEWSRRAAKDRAEQARLADAPWIGSIGRHCEKNMMPAEPGVPAMWVTVCR